MKTLILTASLVATVLASAISVQAAERPARFDGAKFFQELSNRASQ